MNAALGPGALGTGSDSFVKRGPRFNKVPIWLVVLTILKNISQWEGLYILYIMENKKCSKPPTSHLKKANIKWKVPLGSFWHGPDLFVASMVTLHLKKKAQPMPRINVRKVSLMQKTS